MAKESLDDTKRLMGALMRMKPKPHEDMKIGKKAKKSKRTVRKPKVVRDAR
jgi:hypothetical protein